MLLFKETTRTFYIFFYIFITQTSSSEAMPLQSNSIRETELLAKCLGAVVSTEEYRNPTVIIIEYDIICSVSNNLQNMGILTKVLSDECVPQIIIQNFQHLNETAKKFGGSNILVVIFVNKCEISERLDVTVIDAKLKYLIIINEDENCNMDLEKFGRTLQHYDATFISQSENYTLYKFQTIIPEIDENTCDYNVKVKFTTINTCVNGTLDKSVIFPAKETNNLKGCPFNVGMATLYPYSIIENKESLQNLQQINESQIRGSDYEIMKIIAYYLNASLNIYYIYKEDGGAFLHHEFISHLLNGSLDACAGGLYRVYGDSVSYSGRGRGGPSKRGGFKGGKQVIIEPHRHPGVFIARGKEDALVTKNLVPGSEVYGEKRISVETEGEKVEYRVWNPFRSKLAAAIMGGVDAIHMPPGSRILYLGAASGTTVSHVSDIVGPEGLVYAVEFSHRSGRDLINVAKKRTNIIPIIEDARHPLKYRMLVGMVDTIFADVAQPDQARIVSLNAQHFLKNGGHFVISIKASCIDSTAQPEAVFAAEVKKLQADKLKPQEQLTLEPYERDHAVVVGVFRPPPKKT